jgi:hypothetical protein
MEVSEHYAAYILRVQMIGATMLSSHVRSLGPAGGEGGVLALGPTQPPNQWVLRFFPTEKAIGDRLESSIRWNTKTVLPE